MRNVDIKQKECSRSVAFFLFYKVCKKGQSFFRSLFINMICDFYGNLVQIIQIIVAKNFKTIYN